MNDAIQQSGLDLAHIERYREEGFLLVENFFTHEELDHFGKHVDAAVRHRTTDDHRSLTEKNLYEQTFIQCMRLWEDHPQVKPFTFHPKLCAAAAALLQTDRIRLWHDQALYKEPGGRKTDAHLDYPFWPTDRPDLISAWIPFDDVRSGGGMMWYVRGSHTVGITQFVDIGQFRGGEPVDLLSNEEVSRLPLVPVEVRKGSVVFHHACMIHAADANETAHTRRVFTMAYMEDGLRRSRDDVYFSLDRDQVGTGERIEGLGHPVAWPLDYGVLPEPPGEPGPRTGFGFSDDNEVQ